PTLAKRLKAPPAALSSRRAERPDLHKSGGRGCPQTAGDHRLGPPNAYVYVCEMARKTPTPADVVVPVRLTAIQARCLDHVVEHRGAEIASVTGREPTRSGAVRLI